MEGSLPLHEADGGTVEDEHGAQEGCEELDFSGDAE